MSKLRLHYYRREVLGTCCGLALAGCTQPIFSAEQHLEASYTEDWPSVQFDPQNTGTVSGTVPREIERQWLKETGGEGVSSIVVDDGVLVATGDVATQYHGVAQYELNGGLRWKNELPGPVSASPVGHGQVVYVPTETSGGGRLLAFRTTDGERLWTVDVQGEQLFSPTVADETVFLRTTDRLLTVDAESGEISRSRRLPTFEVDTLQARMDIAPAVIENTVCVPSENEVWAIDRDSNERRWRVPLQKVRAGPTVAGQIAVLSSVKGGIVAVDVESGQQRWRRSDLTSWTSPAVTETALYATDGFDLVKLDRESGEGSAKRSLQGDIYSSPIVVGDTVIAGSIDTDVAAFDTDLQTERWSVAESSIVHSSHAVAGQSILVTSRDGKLRAFQPPA
ncbi:PQQ-binding-like beta-propeller repeat protein [Halorhabdus sp. CBA1104]|uniref:outer membrane protein assembly factor BamB family protein n=1 Tax=Halorhabdus sp. CBA1104 TaxID=1380432 RepID=UPI0018A6D2A3|nr:PQQ-binding-like beta-propeller repeat protein [Halorhabdus sp. CBA1104]